MASSRGSATALRCAAIAALVALTGCGASGAKDASASKSPTSASESADPTPAATPSPAGCRDPSKNCLGVLEPGHYASAVVDLFGTGKPGQVTYTVSDGWANTLDHQPAYWLRPATDYLADPASDGNDTTSGIYVWGNVGAAAQTTTCDERSDPKVKTGAASLAAWMKRLHGLEVTPRPDAQVSGHRAIVLDLVVDPPKAQRCSFGPYVPLIASRPDAPDAYMTGIGPQESIRMMLVDLPGGHTVAVLIDAPTQQWAALLKAATPVLATMRLTQGGA